MYIEGDILKEIIPMLQGDEEDYKKLSDEDKNDIHIKYLKLYIIYETIIQKVKENDELNQLIKDKFTSPHIARTKEDLDKYIPKNFYKVGNSRKSRRVVRKSRKSRRVVHHVTQSHQIT